MENKKLIECPKCGQEYTPGEIFNPKHFLGQITDIERDGTGKILFMDGVQQDTTEEYVCDKCGCKFKTIANISYSTSIITPKIDMTTDYVVDIFKDRITLNED